MATPSEVKAGLDDIAETIRTERNALRTAKARIGTGQGNLNLIPTTFADILDEIALVEHDGDAFYEAARAEVASLTPEFIALRDDATGAVTDLAPRFV